VKTRLDMALHLIEQAAGGEAIRGLVALDGAEIPLVRCDCGALLAIGPAAGPHVYDCHSCGQQAHHSGV
jgi:hypothetical protein